MASRGHYGDKITMSKEELVRIQGATRDSSFDKIFGAGGEAAQGDDDKTSMHELFSMTMRDDLTLRDFAQALREMHGVVLTPAAARLLSSTDANSGRLSFAQFQRALQDGGSRDSGGAGTRTNFSDQAAAIMADNAGAPVPASHPAQTGATAKHNTDISKDPYIKRQVAMARGQAAGPFSDNPVVQTNRVSAGNPLAAQSPVQEEDPYGVQNMANTAVRMYVTGELPRREFEKFLVRLGLTGEGESELGRLIESHDRIGDGNFAKMSRSLKREITLADAAGRGSR